MSTGTFVEFIGNPAIVSMLVTTCANFSIGIELMFVICCIDTLNAPAEVAMSGGNIPAKYDPNPTGNCCIIVSAMLSHCIVKCVKYFAATAGACCSCNNRFSNDRRSLI